MMINDRIEFDVEDGIANVVLARPDKMNALDDKMFQAIFQVGEQIRNDKSIRVVVLSGEGKAFCAGLDMANFANMLDSDARSKVMESSLEPRTHGIANAPQYAAWMWHELPIPVIAAVHGVSMGGGFQIALAADMRYVAPKTRFSIMEIKWGIIPDMSSSQLMRHLAPEDIVRELAYTGRIIDAEEAREYGFVTKICDDPLAHAMQVAKQIAGRNPHAIRAIKRVLNDANYVSAEDGLLNESREQDKVIGRANNLEAVTAELEQRPPVFKD